MNILEPSDGAYYTHEAITSFVYVIQNSIDALIKNNNQFSRYIFVNETIKENQIVVTIKDNGGGIDEQIIDRIYEPYFTTKHQSKGTGLGLTLSYDVIENILDGSIQTETVYFDFNNESWKGCKTTIKLPLK